MRNRKTQRLLAKTDKEEEQCQNGVKSWHEDPTGCEAVRNVMKSKQNIILR